jgi:hypothetical protein
MAISSHLEAKSVKVLILHIEKKPRPAPRGNNRQSVDSTLVDLFREEFLYHRVAQAPLHTSMRVRMMRILR